MRRIAHLVAAAAGVLLISSCALLGLGTSNEVKATLAAGALLDYVGSQELEQVQELETAGDTFDLQTAGGTIASVRSISTDVRTIEFPQATVTVTRNLDDGDTETPTDDKLTVTREVDYGFEANRIQVIVRPLKPTAGAEWESYKDGDGVNGWYEDPVAEINQYGTITSYLGDVQLSGGTLFAAWARSGDFIYAKELVKETANVVHPDVVHRTIISQDTDGKTTLVREREVDGEIVHSFSVEEYEDPETGEILVRIVREDGAYAIVVSPADTPGEPRIVDYYTADGARILRVEDLRSYQTGTIISTRTHYGPDGSVVDTRVVTYSINYMQGDEDSVQITRTVDGWTQTVTITESGDVYVVVIAGETYRMRVVDASTVEFLDDAGNVIMTAVQTPDGAWQITTADGVTTV